MPTFEVNGKLFYFAHVPKTGGTSLERYFKARFGAIRLHDDKWNEKWTRELHRSSCLRTSLQHLTAADAARILPRAPDHVFAVVRDPAERLISEFLMHRRSPRARRSLARYGFSFWLGAMLSAVRQDATVFDNHIRPQTDIVPDGARVFRFEDGLDDIIPWLDGLTNDTAENLALGHELAARSQVRPALSRSDLAAIQAFYRIDYERFGYSTEVARGSSVRLAIGSLGGRRIASQYAKGRL